ncbi:MAG: hypothetical protein EBZ75_15825, partial [Oxalobacteraceae bacterium]|nr:hypothetical protein [Oxalobacteraceae bacterium]
MLHAAACVKRACMLRAAAVRHVARAYSVGRFVAPPTVRTGLRDDIRRSLAALHGDYYIVVHGPRCVGKSRLIDAALAGERGVWSVDVMPGTKAAEIIKCATEHLGVASLLQLVGFRPIVVLRVVERTYYNAPAGVAAAVKVLTSKHGLRVIVDAEEYSIDDNVLETTRQCVFWVGEMSRDELMQIPDVQDAMQELTR